MRRFHFECWNDLTKYYLSIVVSIEMIVFGFIQWYLGLTETQSITGSSLTYESIAFVVCGMGMVAGGVCCLTICYWGRKDVLSVSDNKTECKTE
jgi:hypothetical protein